MANVACWMLMIDSSIFVLGILVKSGSGIGLFEAWPQSNVTTRQRYLINASFCIRTDT